MQFSSEWSRRRANKMWVNVLLFLIAVATAAYFYLTRNYGWFKACGVYEHDPSFPFGNPEMNQAMMGKVNFARLSSLIYDK